MGGEAPRMVTQINSGVTSMERVGHHLQLTALKLEDDQAGFDIFGRSAFNRYYYAAYLISRLLVKEINSDLENVPHKDLPTMLTGKIMREVKTYRAKAAKIPDREAVQICTQAISALNSLADLLIEGYGVRVIADYKPEVLISRGQDDRFKLYLTDITDAHGWPVRARAYSTTIRRMWMLVNA